MHGMAKTYRLGRGTRLVNTLFQTMTRLGLGASYRHILTGPGRKTGRLHSTPVDIIQVSGERWLVAGYGPAGWVRNARARARSHSAAGGTPAGSKSRKPTPRPPFQCFANT